MVMTRARGKWGVSGQRARAARPSPSTSRPYPQATRSTPPSPPSPATSARSRCPETPHLPLIRYPADTLVVAFRMPAAPDPVAPALVWLRHIPLLGGHLRRPPQRRALVRRLSPQLIQGARSASSQPQHEFTRMVDC